MRKTLLLLLSFAAAAHAENKVIFLAGSRSHGPGEHEFYAGCQILAKALDAHAGLGVRATVIRGWPENTAVLDDAKAVVVYSDATSVVSKGWEKMDALSKKGTGIVLMHYAVHPSAADGEKYFRPWIGGAFETGWSVNPHWVAEMKALPNHPVSRGIDGPVEALDEFYYNMRFRNPRSDVQDLATATPTRERVKRYINLWNEHGVAGLDKPQTLLWGYQRPEGGRGVGFTGGHYHRNWAVDSFRKLVLNAIVWAAGLEVPEQGVSSPPVSEDELNANLDDKGPNKPRLTIPSKEELRALPPAAIQTERESKFPPAAANRTEAAPTATTPTASAATASADAPKPATPANNAPAPKPLPGQLAASGLIEAGSKERMVSLEASVKGISELHLVVSKEGDLAFDWADWIEPEIVLADGTVVDLTTLPWKTAKAGWGKSSVGKSAGSTPLTVQGKTYTRGIGTHAESRIVYSLPPNAEKFRTKAALDDGGALRDQKPTPALLRFLVLDRDPGSVPAVARAAAAKEPLQPGIPEQVPMDLFRVPEGFEVTLWATSPLLRNPTNIDFDAQGRLFVAEGVNYRSKGNRQPEGDRIVILEDTDADGKADKTSVFVQEPGLASPLGVAVFENKVIVSQPPDLLVYTDVNGDGKFDPSTDTREVLLTGFSGRQHDHSLHSVTAGPDGQWYWNQGNCGAEFSDRSGRKFLIGSPYMTKHVAGMRSDDGNVWIGGFTARMNPDGTQVTILGHNYRNSYEQAVTSLGDLFQSDNDDPPACRVSAILEGGNAGFASADGKRSWGADRRPGQSTPVAEWRQEDPGTMPAGDVYGGGSPTGVAFYENGAMGDAWSGLLLACEAGKNVVFGYFPKPDGAGWKLERFDFLTSNPERAWAGSDFLGGAVNAEAKTRFRPSDVCVGPDGAIYVADWYDPRVGGHQTLDGSLSGSIYRIAPKGFRSKVPKMDLSTTQGQIAALQSPAVNVRHSGFVRLKAQGAAAVPAVAELLAHSNPYIAARAVWLLAQLGDAGVARVRPLLDSPDETLRMVAYRSLRRTGADIAALASKMASDPSAAVRREVALSLRGVPAQESVPVLARLAASFDGKDRAYLEALGLGATGLEDKVYAAVSAKMGGDPERWSPPMEWIAWRLHPDSAIADLEKRVLSPALPAEQRDRALTAIAFNPSPRAAQAAVAAASAKPSPVNAIATWWLLNRKDNLWSDHQLPATLKKSGIYDPDAVTLQPVEMPVTPPNAPKLPSTSEILKLAGDAGRGRSAIAACYSCHRVGEHGIEFGPDLSTFARQQPREVVIQAILQPSADISHGYEGSELTTKEGVKITGMLLSNGDPYIIKCMGGIVQTIPKNRVASLKPLGRSLMYDPEILGLSPQAVADIVAYLSEPR